MVSSPAIEPRRRAWAQASPVVAIRNVSKTYASGFEALKHIDLDIRRGEIFALLGPNGAGKTTLISIICGIVNASSGTVVADGHDIVRDYRGARCEDRAGAAGAVDRRVRDGVGDGDASAAACSASRRTPRTSRRCCAICRCGTRRNDKIMTLSGGMKRRVLIAKALSHEPQILFLDEPTAGVDVELRHDMWQMVRACANAASTIILTTHYIEEAEEMADRIGVINKGELILVEDKTTLMRKLGKQAAGDLRCRRRSRRCPTRWRTCRLRCRRTALAGLHLRHADRRDRHRAAAAPACTSRASTSRTCIPARARWRTSSSAWCRAPA